MVIAVKSTLWRQSVAEIYAFTLTNRNENSLRLAQKRGIRATIVVPGFLLLFFFVMF